MSNVKTTLIIEKMEEIAIIVNIYAPTEKKKN